jgi:gamma-butyrobetaine dioxygenase
VTAIISEIFELFARFGSERYGEDLSLDEHMVQSAAMARSLGAPGSLVVAALLHDVGHYLHADSALAVTKGRDLEHEAIGALWLSRAFDTDVTAPIALHVQAKRYLCAVEPGYFELLSEASRSSLVVQGGAMSGAEAAAFATKPGFEAALLLRRCDDRGKDASIQTPSLESYRELMMDVLRQPRRRRLDEYTGSVP